MQACMSSAWLPGRSSQGGKSGEDAFPGKQLVGCKRQKDLVQAELVVPNIE